MKKKWQRKRRKKLCGIKDQTNTQQMISAQRMCTRKNSFFLTSHFTIIFMKRWIMNFHYRGASVQGKTNFAKKLFLNMPNDDYFVRKLFPENAHFFLASTSFRFFPFFFRFSSRRFTLNCVAWSRRTEENEIELRFFSLSGDDAKSLWSFLCAVKWRTCLENGSQRCFFSHKQRI